MTAINTQSIPLSRKALAAPSDRLYAAVHWTFMSLIAVIALYGAIMPRFIAVSRPSGFRLIVMAMICMNVLWWSIADRRFARHIASSHLSRALRVLTAMLAILLNAPIVYMILAGHFPSFIITAPPWYAAAITLWHLGLVMVMPAIAGIRLLILALVASVRRMTRSSVTFDQSPTDPCDLSRRAWLKTVAGSAPMLLLAGGTAASQMQAGHFEVNRRDVKAPWLPDRLRGLTITHVSDLHVGRLFRPYMLPRLIDEVNRLDSDILVVTGDIVDISNDVLPPALEAILAMRHRYGIFACIGNHDEIDNRALFISQTKRSLPLLIDERRVLNIGGERLTIAGIDWARLDLPGHLRRGHGDHVKATLSGYDASREGSVIALAHHPHAWDSLALAGVPLVLSGHTHGGQIMFNPPDVRPDTGAGSMLFRYVRGFYEKAGSTLFVNRGVGNWFPLRINAPAEVVQLRLV